MKRTLLVSVLFASALILMLGTTPASAATRVYVAVAPPPLVVETVPVAPGPNHVWIAGYHRWDGHAYVWVKGHYVVAPRPHAAWVAGHWVHHASHGWYWVDGHWR
ncbi:MAG TPA: hypothetical protein VEG84_06740 [Thermoanaerobaculia bacterium]|nr:hypothetical protein [Thermoanaerobaculia bacterium]